MGIPFIKALETGKVKGEEMGEVRGEEKWWDWREKRGKKARKTTTKTTTKTTIQHRHHSIYFITG